VCEASRNQLLRDLEDIQIARHHRSEYEFWPSAVGIIAVVLGVKTKRNALLYTVEECLSTKRSQTPDCIGDFIEACIEDLIEDCIEDWRVFTGVSGGMFTGGFMRGFTRGFTGWFARVFAGVFAGVFPRGFRDG
jgi:hypothetical protein